MITKTDQGAKLNVFIQPNASKNEIIGPHNGALKIKIQTPPVDGKANEELIKFLSKILEHPKKNIVILKGETSRSKLVLITGLGLEQIKQKLGI
ncbi:MAG: YggU family protein [Bdellovibrionaceae bacterium]|nr:YggU family protein [Pseudobdellovibrionaceae bacterium]